MKSINTLKIQSIWISITIQKQQDTTGHTSIITASTTASKMKDSKCGRISRLKVLPRGRRVTSL